MGMHPIRKFPIITGQNEVLAKVIFLHLSVIHSVHRGEGEYLTRPDTPPGTRPLPPQNSRLRNTVNDQPVCILLECILVLWDFYKLWEI